jgi:hypothetical protein
LWEHFHAPPPVEERSAVEPGTPFADAMPQNVEDGEAVSAAAKLAWVSPTECSI